MGAKFKVAVVGNGMIANAAHIPAWKDIPDKVEIVAVADNREQASKETAERYGIPGCYTDYREMLEKVKPDIVSVCTPNCYHKEVAIAALKAGANVLCEKPISTSEANAKEMYKTAEECGKVLYVSQTMRFSQSVIAAKKFYDEGLIGRAYYIEANSIRRRGIPKWGFFHMKEHNAAGPGYDLGVHIVDSLLWIMGSPKVLAASGAAYTEFGDQDEGLVESLAESGAPIGLFTPRKYDYREFDVEDFIAGFIRLEGGATMILKTSWAINAPEDGGASYIAGTKGGIKLSPKAELITNLAGYQLNSSIKLPQGPQVAFSGHYDATKQFIAVLEGKEEILVKKEQVLNVIRTLDALYASSESGKEVVI
ncbi:MAG: Gfo/Idh/MocA family oxidoreductase [Oscillospiraceae bacterium]|nr:Gfo/Idh/MocA family oxidoreductase [Oscillospiraceae bacterium]